jgi:two-component system, cell cycle sensor histidine kinase and response regulator CckA
METVLVVDDEPAVLNLCRRMLEVGGYQVLAAGGGNEALQLLESSAQPIDLALLDVVMPTMNGIELANRIRQARPDVRILLMSGFGPNEVARVLGSQPYRIMWKPFKTESLLRMIENALAATNETVSVSRP